MAGVSVESGRGGRRSLDSEINMIPMIDLLMVTISFLLITAVWVNFERLQASGQAPGGALPCEDCKEEPKLHVETSDPSKYVLAWKQGRTVLHTAEVARDGDHRRQRGVPLADLAAKAENEWRSAGSHREASDRRFDQAVVHAANEMPYSELVAVMDAIGHAKRPWSAGGKVSQANAFEVVLAAD